MVVVDVAELVLLQGVQLDGEYPVALVAVGGDIDEAQVLARQRSGEICGRGHDEDEAVERMPNTEEAENDLTAPALPPSWKRSGVG